MGNWWVLAKWAACFSSMVMDMLCTVFGFLGTLERIVPRIYGVVMSSY